MATEVIKIHRVHLYNGTELEVSPLKIKYLREFMDAFSFMKNAKTDDEIMMVLIECVRICMKQFYPKISNSIEEIEDNFDLKTIYSIIDYAGGIKFDANEDEISNTPSDNGSSWEDVDLAKLEAEIFRLGKWKNYEELENCMSMPELVTTLSTQRDLDYQEKKFLAAIQGVDLDSQSGKEDAWEEMKNRILYKGKGSNDITTLTGRKAAQAGFGIGMGLDYEEITA
jgi:hypothetical protein